MTPCDEIRQHLAAAIQSVCKRGDCQLDLTGVSSEVIVADCDKLPDRDPQDAICDFLLFVSSAPLQVVAVEIKSRSWKAREVAAQLQGGAEVADRVLGRHQVRDFCPLLLFEAAHTQQVKVFEMLRVLFRGKRNRILGRRCGARLSQILKK